MRTIVAALLVCLAAAAGADERRAVVVRDGAREVTVDLARLVRLSVTLTDSTDGGRRKQLDGVLLSRVLAALPAPAGADAVAVRCDDGWMALVPLAAVARHTPVLAFAEEGRPLAPPRGPVFLVWADEAARTDPEVTEAWAWSVAAFEYVRTREALAPSEPRPGAPPAVRRGAALFRRHCLSCHAARGFGGMSGWDLARPGIVAYRGEPRVRAYVTDPRRINPDGRMPPFAGRIAGRDLDDLIAYLKSVGEPIPR